MNLLPPNLADLNTENLNNFINDKNNKNIILKFRRKKEIRDWDDNIDLDNIFLVCQKHYDFDIFNSQILMTIIDGNEWIDLEIYNSNDEEITEDVFFSKSAAGYYGSLTFEGLQALIEVAKRLKPRETEH